VGKFLVCAWIIVGFVLIVAATYDRKHSQIVGVTSHPELATIKETDEPCIGVKSIPGTLVYADGHTEPHSVETMVNLCGGRRG
jgi:hypothetical protein